MISKFNIFRKKRGKEKDLLILELAEIREIADAIFKRLNRKIAVLEAMEASVDEKIMKLEELIKKADSLNLSTESDRRGQIASLARKGMDSREIAEILEVPVGEVELLLNLSGMAGSRKN